MAPGRLVSAVAAAAVVAVVVNQSMRAQTQWDLGPDVIFSGGAIVTMQSGFPVAEALALKDGRIVAVGSRADVLALRTGRTRVVDTMGKTILPGLQDSHIHFTGLGHAVQTEVDLTFAQSARDAVRLVGELKDRNSPRPGEWLVGRRWDQYKYPRMFTRWDLDEVSAENPVRLSRVYRGVAVNTAAFRRMGIDDQRSATWPSWWLKDPDDFTAEDRILRERRTVTVDGSPRTLEVPTGVFLGARASRLLGADDSAALTFEQRVASIRTGAEEMLRLGVTAIVDPASGMGESMRIYQEAYNRGWLPLRVAAVHEGIFNTHPPEEIARHLDGIKVNRLGDRFLRWQGVKFYADGGAGSRSSWLSEPFARSQEIEGRPYFGLPVEEDDAVREAQFRAAVNRGWDLHTHSTGDRAIRQTVTLYMKLIDEIRASRPDADLRWSIIHAYMPIEPRTMVLPDMAKFRIIASINPVFLWQLGSSFITNLGTERVERAQPFRSYEEAGVMMASGSDYGVAHHNPWLGMYAMLTRKEQGGDSLGSRETVGIETALRSYTINGAYLTYDDESRGTLEQGKLADLVVLDIPDIRDVEPRPELLLEMEDRILLTLVEGKVGFQRQGFAF